MRLVLDARAGDLRRRVGANAWVVLEELLLGATVGHAGEAVSRATVRALAERTGLSKDTVARSLQRLRKADAFTVERNATTTAAASSRSATSSTSPRCPSTSSPTSQPLRNSRVGRVGFLAPSSYRCSAKRSRRDDLLVTNLDRRAGDRQGLRRTVGNPSVAFIEAPRPTIVGEHPELEPHPSIGA